ncbi:hypothetical protein [Haloferula sp. A504]|uniref:hypothetical protein n=1 Tax=Haloferula sp. A504 TaxID=3373601 RepID=UPI0031C70A5D|nr:hypothetical protein [Verrucomicrobiaceae bacterium E54]
MHLAFIGGGGAGGVLVLIGLLILLLLSLLLVAVGVTFACMKKPKLSAVSFCVALGIGGYLYSFYSEVAKRAELGASRKTDFEVEMQLCGPGGYAVLVDGEPFDGERVMLDGTIRFSINFDEVRSLSGECSSFDSIHDGGEFESLHLFGLKIAAEERASFLASFESAPQGADRSGWTEDYWVAFRTHHPARESLECRRRVARGYD